MRCWCRRRLASSCPTLSRTVISRSLVISSATLWRGSVAKRTSRLVRMPTSLPARPLPPPSTTGMPEMPWSCISVSASASVASGAMVTGLTTMPDSNFLTWRTCAACSSGSRLRWMTPMPPACAMAMAILASVTVSMAEAMIGILSEISRVRRVRISASDGSTSDNPGVSRTSSKVSASRRVPLDFWSIANSNHPACGLGRRHRRKRDSARSAAKRQSRARLDDPVLGWRRSLARLAGES